MAIPRNEEFPLKLWFLGSILLRDLKCVNEAYDPEGEQQQPLLDTKEGFKKHFLVDEEQVQDEEERAREFDEQWIERWREI